jgi:ankyrin repeat protein
LLEKGASVSRYHLFGEDLLEWSALNARDIHQVLVEKTARSGGPLPIGDIVYAAEAGTLPFAKFLRTHKATISQTQLEKALTESLSHSKFRATLVLLENGVDPNRSTLEDSARPLMASIAADGIKYSEILINKGASVNLLGLLVSAVDQDNFELVNLLIDKGADLETYGPEAPEMAAEYGNIEIAALLLDKVQPLTTIGKFSQVFMQWLSRQRRVCAIFDIERF